MSNRSPLIPQCTDHDVFAYMRVKRVYQRSGPPIPVLRNDPLTAQERLSIVLGQLEKDYNMATQFNNDQKREELLMRLINFLYDWGKAEIRARANGKQLMRRFDQILSRAFKLRSVTRSITLEMWDSINRSSIDRRMYLETVHGVTKRLMVIRAKPQARRARK